jgi:hypothetical protein
VSLLERTEGLQGGAFSRLLKTQYRMNADISDWSSQEMYAGALLAAESVRGRLLADLEVRTLGQCPAPVAHELARPSPPHPPPAAKQYVDRRLSGACPSLASAGCAGDANDEQGDGAA